MNPLTPLTPTISAIKLPDGATEPSINRIIDVLAYRNRYGFTETTAIPPGKWNLVGLLSELTPEQKAEIVEITDNPFWIRQGKPYIDYTCNTNCFSSIDDAFQSLLQSKRVYTVNPYGDFEGKRININAFNGAGGFINGELLTMSGYVKKFDEAQQYVGNWILIKKEV